VLSATARTDWSPSSPDWDQEPTWSAGLTLSWNLFDGGRASADIRIARANVQSSIAQRDALLVSLTSQLELSRGKAERLRRLLPVGATPRIAEVGSFVGGFLAAARERGWSAVGIDPGEEVGEFCREKGFAVLQTTAPEAPVEAPVAEEPEPEPKPEEPSQNGDGDWGYTPMSQWGIDE